MKRSIREQYLSAAAIVIGLILVLLPFHAVFTSWLGATFNHSDLFRIWKELLMVPLTIIVLSVLAFDKQLQKALKPYKTIAYLMVGYSVLSVIIGLWAYHVQHVNAPALIDALLINTRFFVFFLICLIVGTRISWLKQHWKPLLLYPAMLVVGFGLLQQFVLPANALSHVGYGPKTILPYQTVDNHSQYVRIQSTLRGPNPLGAYLVIILSVLVALLLKVKADRKRRLWLGIGIVATAVVLFFTYSRSGYLGSLLALALLVYWSLTHQKVKQYAWLAITAGLVVLLGLTLIFRHNTVFENTLFHTSQTSQSSESSNAVRTQAQIAGIRSIEHQPLGDGPGTAGPASVRNFHPARIAEDYFIQIGQEVGVIGLGLFIAINVLIARALWTHRQDQLVRVLLASLIGITLVNLLSHAWSDDTLSLIWWGFAGLALSPAILKKTNRNRDEKKTILQTTRS